MELGNSDKRRWVLLELTGELQLCLTILARISRTPLEAFTSFKRIHNINQVNKGRAFLVEK